MTYSVKELHEHLQKQMGRHEGRLFGFEDGNAIGEPAQCVLDTPRGRWRVPGDLSRGHSNFLPLEMFKLVTTARNFVDIVTMNLPSGMFYNQIMDSLLQRSRAPYPVTIRFLIGVDPSQPNIDTKKMLEELRKRIGNEKHQLTVYLGQYRWKEASWGHSKLIAVDGKRLMTGGHNMWANDYLENDPVFDLTMRFDGPIAQGAHQFADKLWDFVRLWNQHINPGSNTYCNRLTQSGITNNPPPRERPALPTERIGKIDALWVTNPGWGVFREPNGEVTDGSGMLALIRGLEKATHCRMSQQDIGTGKVNYGNDFQVRRPRDYPHDLICCKKHWFCLPLLDALADLLCRSEQTKLDLVMSSPENRGRSYTNAVEFGVFFNVLSQRINVRHKLDKDKALEKLNRQVTIKTIAFDNPRRFYWPSGDPKFNHAKFWMLDGQIFYVGSENLYPSLKKVVLDLEGSLQEFGVIVESVEAVQTVLENYFEPMFDIGPQTVAQRTDLTW